CIALIGGSAVPAASLGVVLPHSLTFRNTWSRDRAELSRNPGPLLCGTTGQLPRSLAALPGHSNTRIQAHPEPGQPLHNPAALPYPCNTLRQTRTELSRLPVRRLRVIYSRPHRTSSAQLLFVCVPTKGLLRRLSQPRMRQVLQFSAMMSSRYSAIVTPEIVTPDQRWKKGGSGKAS